MLEIIIRETNPLHTRYFRIDGRDQDDYDCAWLEELNLEKDREDSSYHTEHYVPFPKEDILNLLREAIIVTHTDPLKEPCPPAESSPPAATTSTGPAPQT